MQMFRPTIFTQEWAPGIWPTILRVLVGLLMIGHGGDKLFNGLESFIQMIASRGWPAPELQAFMAVFIEFGGGILLVVGLFTRPAAFALIVQFFIITFVWGYGSPFFQGQEKGFVYFVLSIYLFFVGPGRFSVDHFLFGRRALQQDASTKP